jgi:hypothetical protein
VEALSAADDAERGLAGLQGTPRDEQLDFITLTLTLVPEIEAPKPLSCVVPAAARAPAIAAKSPCGLLSTGSSPGPARPRLRAELCSRTD